MKDPANKEFRWTIRGLSGLIIIFGLVMFMMTEVIQPESGEPLNLSADAILQLSVVGIGLIGLAIAWKWELIGGMIALIAFIGLVIINPEVLKAYLLFIWPVTAALFIVLWVQDRNASLKKNE